MNVASMTAWTNAPKTLMDLKNIDAQNKSYTHFF